MDPGAEVTGEMQRSRSSLSNDERQILLRLARETIAAHTRSGVEPEVRAAELPPALQEPRACFVTLTEHGKLRGCIGTIEAREALYRAVRHNAHGAAFRDSRFAPVEPGEVPELEIEISILTNPQPLAFNSSQELCAKLRPEVDGVVLRAEGRAATFLPQVWEKLPRAEDFLQALARKAGLFPDAWREPEVVVLTYQVESFRSAPAT
jgi:AmmeMemoRadiSam system protein A